LPIKIMRNVSKIIDIMSKLWAFVSKIQGDLSRYKC